MTTEKNKKLIANFLGLKIVGGYLQKYVDSDTEPKQYWEGKPRTFEYQICGWQIIHHESKMQYHLDWNLLMEVVEKIYQTDLYYDKYIDFNSSMIDSGKIELSTNINHVYNACVEFINWYNEQPK